MKVKILKYDDLGNGICKINEKICFVKKALPFEIVDRNILKDKKNYMEADIINIIEKNKSRIDPICPHYSECGGCNFLHITKDSEIEFKKEKYLNYFNRLDSLYLTKEYFYRNKVVFHVKNGHLGFYKEKSNSLVEINSCYLVYPVINKIYTLFKEKIDFNWNGKLLIRASSSNETMVSIEGEYKYVNILKEEDLINNLIYNNKVIKGRDYFIEKIDYFKFKVHYNAFFQVNILGLKKIYQVLGDFLQDKKFQVALDLYSGTSVLGIYMSRFIKKIISVEANSDATLCAKENLKLNSISNLKIINGLVEDYIDTFKNIDFILLDPARRGLDKKTIEYLKKINASYIFYIACGFDSLKRDLKLLDDSYVIEKITSIDMFPKTNNVESICILKRK